MRPVLFFLCTVLQTADSAVQSRSSELGVNHLLLLPFMLVFSRITPLAVRSRRVHIFYTATSGSLSVYRCNHNVLSTNCKENALIRKRKKRMWRECHPVSFLCTLVGVSQSKTMKTKKWCSEVAWDHVQQQQQGESEVIHRRGLNSCGWSDGFRSWLILKAPTIYFSGES